MDARASISTAPRAGASRLRTLTACARTERTANFQPNRARLQPLMQRRRRRGPRLRLAADFLLQGVCDRIGVGALLRVVWGRCLVPLEIGDAVLGGLDPLFATADDDGRYIDVCSVYSGPFMWILCD